jgi:hypothetical protein
MVWVQLLDAQLTWKENVWCLIPRPVSAHTHRYVHQTRRDNLSTRNFKYCFERLKPLILAIRQSNAQPYRPPTLTVNKISVPLLRVCDFALFENELRELFIPSSYTFQLYLPVIPSSYCFDGQNSKLIQYGFLNTFKQLNSCHTIQKWNWKKISAKTCRQSVLH